MIMKTDFSNSTFNNKGNSFFLPSCLLLFSLFFSCTHKIATNKLPATQIVFGHGGGFVGVERQHALLPDGRIIQFVRDSPTQKIVKKIGAQKAASFYAEVDSLNLNILLYNAPGNIFHYLVLKGDGKRDHKIVWDGGGGDKNIPVKVEAFYQKLRAELPKRKHKRKKADVGQDQD